MDGRGIRETLRIVRIRRPRRTVRAVRRRSCDGRPSGAAGFVAFAALALAVLFPCAAAAASLDLSISTDYSRGDYGGQGHVDIVYVPAIVRLETYEWTFKAIFPYLYISGGSSTVDLPTGPVVTPNGTSEGLGDIQLEVSRWFAPMTDLAPFVEIAARLKLPTASENDGLGTGEADFLPEVQLARVYGRWTPYASLGFRILGDDFTIRRPPDRPPRKIGTTYRDGLLASAGLTYRASELLEPGLFAYWRQAATKGSADPVELLPTLRLWIGDRWLVDLYATVGFTSSSPDAGCGMQLHYRIPDVF